MAEALLDVSDLRVHMLRGGKAVRVIDGLSLRVEAGRTTCLVGESGCGKSLTARAILRLLPPGFRAEGHVRLNGRDLLSLPEAEMRRLRGRELGMIFQEPMTALNPVLTVGFQAAEPLRRHLGLGAAEARAQVLELFAQVGMAAPDIRYDEYPHQLSGGMRQRVLIAMALACRPRLLLADEPTTALDVTIQNQILRLLRDQTRQRGMGLLLITHDLGVVAGMADSVGVMYAGQLVEHAPADALFSHPRHPYTQGLMRCAPTLTASPDAPLPVIEGAVPAPGTILEGCLFRSRCPRATAQCAREAPPLEGHPHGTACWHPCRD
ncbi:MAG: ABC transporter ATP-binding protein [Desulfovibrionaceae bacterium]